MLIRNTHSFLYLYKLGYKLYLYITNIFISLVNLTHTSIIICNGLWILCKYIMLYIYILSLD